MVDSSIGGKTAVDTLHGKNLVGSFHQPRHIYIDLKYLRTLPHREFVNGLAEVIKTAAIWDADDFALLENNADEILALNLNKADIIEETDHSLLMRVILGSVRVKAYVVTIDEKETGLRGLLNFGHSVGHAIEAILAPELLHGECVSMGMIKEAEISRHLGYLNDVDVGRLSRCLQAYGLPLGVEDKRVRQLAPSKFCPVDRLLNIMRVDKKNMGDRKRIVLLSSIGQPFEERATFVEDVVIRKILSPSIEVVPVAPGLKSDLISLTVPGSKSLSNRSLVLAALGKGTCRLKGLLHSDDVQVMLDALQKLVGISYSWEDKGETLVVTGGAGKLQVPSSEIYLGNAGTAARFLTTVCSLVREASGGHSHTIVTGNARMKQRPIAHLVDALRSNGCTIEYLESEGCLPLKIHPNGVGLKGGLIKLSANISSQYVSSILLSAPYATAPVTLELIGNAVVSQPYIDMTLAMMASFGINVKREGDNIYHIPQGVYTNPDVYLVEADASSATYPLAFAAITGQTVKVTNIGSNSLQGDAEFAVKVLKTMGCDVTQTATETTVKGPKFLRPIPQIDMESMTDAFLTASVLAAVAVGADGRDHTTRITGIANQRVKECNRIAAMVAELGKFGVRAGELPDGIEIHGTGNGGAGLRVPEGGVKCYDDHRVAMSFSVLASAMPGGLRAVVNEKKCVEKTWPSWWDTLETKLGVRLLGVDISHGGTNSGCTSATYSDKDLADDSIVFIGMRGAGKSSMGRAVSRAFGWSYIDMDAYFEARENTAIPAFVTKHGWDEFRRRERAHLQAVLAENPKRCVITCGGGIIETPESRSILTSWSSGSGKRHVIHLRRCIDDIVAYLLKDPTRPVYGEDTRAVWARREPLYRSCATSEFFSLRSNDGSFSAAELELIRLIRFLHRQSGQPPLAGFSVSPSFPRDSSFFVSLTVPDVREALDSIRLAAEGADAFELRVDLLGDQSDELILQQIAALRRTADIPIVFTVRTCGQGGKFPDADETRMFDLLHRAVAWGCEFVDVEVLDTGRVERRDLLQKFVQKKGNSHLIASYHDVSGTAVWVESSGMGVGSKSGQALQSVVRMRDKLDELARYGDSVKLIGRAKSIGDNFALQQFVWTAMTRGNATKPLIAINMGAEGQMSRILNSYMTPVTHPALPTAAAPGQLSVAEIHRGRALLGLLDRRRFFLFGSPISTSPSPAMHNAGFDCLGLPYTYELSEDADPEHVKAVVQAAVKEGKFGGASVTIPHKETVMRLGIVSSVTDAARTIGAVNTLIPSKD
ncbi:3-dehydroquinate dehydratase (3-dehydroquinase), partial [Cladochytrium tenue]